MYQIVQRPGMFMSVWFPAAVFQGAAGEPDSEGEAGGDGAAAQPEQSGARETATGSANLPLPRNSSVKTGLGRLRLVC